MSDINDHRKITETLTEEFGEVLKAHYLGRALSRDNVLDILNALGVTAAYVLAGTGPSQEALDFFRTAVAQQLAAIKADMIREAIAPRS
jgi:hypothetical protein